MSRVGLPLLPRCHNSHSEDLNQLVKRHLQVVVSQSPAKAFAILEHDTSELIASGMVTLNAKISDIDDEKLIVRVVELWGFFWDQVLPYVEGVRHSPTFVDLDLQIGHPGAPTFAD